MIGKFLRSFFSKDEGEEEKERPTTLRLAVEKGFVTEAEACDYEDEMNTGDLGLENTHTSLMIDRDMLTHSQAEVIAIDVKKQDPQQALSDRFKTASKAMKENACGAKDVGTKTQSFRVIAGTKP